MWHNRDEEEAMRTHQLFGGAGMAAAVLAALAMAAAHPPAFASAQDPDRAEAAEARAEAAAEAAGARAEEAGERLGAQIEQAIRAGGPFFNAEERAAVERACGYPAGSWDGYEANMSDGVFRCSNGRRVDSAEMRRVMEAAGPRIGARVSAAMNSPEVRSAMERVTSEATQAALASIDEAEIARIATEASREAIAEAQREIAEAQREIEHSTRDAGERRSRRR
jgi:hypothetical protein